jgi:hypothetical protein
MSLDEARLLAAINARSQRLFADGYRAAWLDDHLLEILTPQGDTYEIDTISGTCSCPFFTRHQGKYSCKHVLGTERLLADQETMQSHNARQIAEWEALA